MIKEDRIHLYADDAQKIINQILLRLICSQWNMLTLIIRFERFFVFFLMDGKTGYNQSNYLY